MASCTTTGFHAWARDIQGLTWSETESAAFYQAYCRAYSARDRHLLWFFSEKLRIRNDQFSLHFVELYKWAVTSRTKEAKRMRDAFWLPETILKAA
jgi:hypothetical protein